MEEIKLSYVTKGWPLPSGTQCSSLNLPTITVEWNNLFADAAARAVSALPGGLIEFVWTGEHNVYKMPSEDAWNRCDFSNAQRLPDIMRKATFNIPLTATGVHYFACQISGHCGAGQKLALTLPGAPSVVVSTPVVPVPVPVPVPAVPVVPVAVPVVPAPVQGPVSNGVCSGRVTMSAATGSLSDGPGRYPTSSGSADTDGPSGMFYTCEWLIEPGAAVTLTFSSMSTESGYDFVKVYNGASTASPLLAQVSGNNVPQPITSSGPMLVVLESDYSVVADGFTATYSTNSAGTPVSTPSVAVPPPPVLGMTPSSSSTTVCSGANSLTTLSGSFTDGVGNYGNNMQCMWLIEVPSGTIRLSFTQFNTEAGYDFVKVYDGSSVSAQLLTQPLSGASPPGSITSSSNMMYVVFTTDSSVVGPGFQASYQPGGSSSSVVVPVPSTPVVVPSVPSTTTAGACTRATTLTAVSGSISDGPGSYSNDAVCSWFIQVGVPVTFTFSTLNTEANYDFVKIYEGVSSVDMALSSPLSGLLLSTSGASAPGPVTANSGSMLVVFSSDFSVNAGGFEASYSTSGAASPIVPAASVGTGQSVPCQGTTSLTFPTGSFSDGPGSYTDNRNCRWEIRTGAAVTLSFDSFNTESGYDWVKVYNGVTTSSQMLLEASGSSMPGTVASTGPMLVVFTSDSSVTSAGFVARYS